MLGDAGAEFFAVLGRAAGLRGNEPRPSHAARAHLVATDQQRLDRPFDRRLADAARSSHALAETNDARERVDDAKPVGRRTRDQKPAIIGAEIERGVGSIGLIVQERLRVRRARSPSRRMPYGVRRGQRARRRGAPRPSRPPVGGASSFIQYLPAAPELCGSTAAAMFKLKSGQMYQPEAAGPILCFSRL